MARGVQQREFTAPIQEPCLLGKDGYATGFFQRMGIEKGVAVVYAAELPKHSRAVEQPLGKCGLARVHMSKYPYSKSFHVSIGPFL